MSATYLKPMLDAGSPRVFNINQLTRRILAKDPAAPLFFRNKPMNSLVLIKDAVPASERRGGDRPSGTKLYFPFNEEDIYEGGRSIFIHDSNLRRAITERFGQDSVSEDERNEDIRILAILDKLPSLDPFLMKDAFRREGIAINDAYFDVSAEAWNEIEMFILQRFKHLVNAAFPDAAPSDTRGRRLIEKMWEAKDLEALQPMVEAFRLPQNEALEIFSAWKGIVFYAFQYERLNGQFIELFKWLKEIKVPFGVKTPAERKEFIGMLEFVKSQLRSEWQMIENVLREYQDAYDKAFKHKTSLTEFLTFLRKSSKAYWLLGNSLGKAGQANYCWRAMTSRFPERKLPWAPLQEVIRVLADTFPPEKSEARSAAW